MTAWYNENDAYAAGWLRSLIRERLIADGEVDTRSVVDVRSADLDGFDQCHFFAGIGGFSLALRRAGWPDARPVWTGSCPCGPFSRIGKKAGYADPRHLWPTWARLIEQRRPATIFGEQSADAARWLRLVRGDLEALGYAVGSLPIEAACADAEHLRDRYWFVAHRDSESGQSASARHRSIGEASEARHDAGWRGLLVNSFQPRLERHAGNGDDARAESQAARSAAEAGLQFAPAWDYWIGIDGKVRRARSGLRLVADGIPARVDKLRALGNAIDSRPAAAFIRAAMQSIGGES